MASNQNPIHKIIMDQYIPYMGEIFAALGSPEPRLNALCPIGFQLGQKFATYKK